jgi:predicted permease
MLKTYFKTALRNLIRNKAFSFINIIGLSIGISAALVIFLIVQYDFSFDKFQKNGDRIYRVVSVFGFSGEVYKNSGVTSPLGNTMRKEATGLEIIAPFRIWDESEKLTVPAFSGHPQVTLKNENKIVFADEAYFKLIPYQWLAGSPTSSLNEPNQVVLTEKAAQLYFPKSSQADIIGKEIIFDDTVRARVTGLVKNLERNTDFTFTTFVSRITLEKTGLRGMDRDHWNNTNGNSQLFVQLAPGTSVTSVEKQLNGLLEKYQKKEEGDNSTTELKLQPLSDLHFNADFGNFDHHIANKNTLYGLLAVAAFLLLLGCINFINLTTAQGSQRAKEIGIRKTMGSSKQQLIFQFLIETFFITLIATILSIAFTPLLLKVFGDFIPPELHFNLLEQPVMMAFLVVLVVLVSFLAGFYPAMVLSGFRPVNVLKNQSNFTPGKSRKAWVRKGLTVSQFAIAQFFILATLVVGQQIHYTLNKDLGFQKNAIIHFTTNYRDTVKSHKAVLAEKIKAIPEVAMMGMSSGTPASNSSSSTTIKYKDGKKELASDVQMKFADTSYLNQFQLKLLAGKNFTQSDTVKEFLINETYARFLGFSNPGDAIGKYVEWQQKQVPIIGVLADFHQKSLHQKIKPLALGNGSNILRTFSITLQPKNADGSNWKAAIAKIEKCWKEVYPADDFDYAFLDQTVANFYASEQHISSLLRWATGLTVFISCLGLLGLVIYTTNQRTKEIGVRKVLGASITHIVSILTKDFILLIVIAFLIATPVAWWAANNWLENFAYRTSINIWLFLGAGLLTITVALITISFQTIKAAAANPVMSLRTE